jgi:hypothetical protein
MRTIYKKDGSRSPENRREEHKRNKVQRRKWYLRFNYGITPEEYDDILARQDCGCGICGRKPVASGRYNVGHVDHDHSKKVGDIGYVRGILCSDCNLGGGRYKDDPKLLRRAADWYANFTGNGLSISNLKCETWASNQNHEERHFFKPAQEIGYQSSKYIFGYNPTVISEAKIARIWKILEESDE